MKLQRFVKHGVSLFELMVVILLLGIVAAVAVTSASATYISELSSLAEQVASDLAYCRSLAIVNASRYEIEFVAAENRYTIRHSGTDPTLSTMPKAPFRRVDDPANEHRVYFDDRPSLSGHVTLIGAQKAVSGTWVKSIEFGPLGQTTSSEPTRIWLAAGPANAQIYLPVAVEPTTGLATVGSFQSTSPGTPPPPAAEATKTP